MKSLKAKIILSSVVCIVAVGIFSSLVLYRSLNGVIERKNTHINDMYLNTAYNQLAENLYQLEQLYSLCANDLYAAEAMGLSRMESIDEKRTVLRAHDQMTAYMRANIMVSYIDKLIIFNEDGVVAQVSTGQQMNRLDDSQRVMVLPEFAATAAGSTAMQSAIAPSITRNADCLMLMGPIYNFTKDSYAGYLYIEVSLGFVADTLAAYDPGSLFVTADGIKTVPSELPDLPADIAEIVASGSTQLEYDGRVYQLGSRALPLGNLALASCFDITFLTRDDYPAIFAAVVLASSILLVGLLLSFVLSGIITRPLNRLTERLRRVGENDFSYDAELERGNDEIAEAGRVVNEMCAGIDQLLKESEEMYIRQKNNEIALLQSQVNPHFLYNTLDSIKWMASIQKNTGIVNISTSLINLLRNLSKGIGEKIMLGEELALLADYAAIQSIRYMETFTLVDNIPQDFYKYQIIKFTLQPLVENAIFHGIEPTGVSGTVTLDGRLEGDDLLLTVTDDGVGMSREELKEMLANKPQEKGAKLTGIGVFNVDSRLKLMYGQRYGLTYESEKGRFTRVSIRLPKEV